MKGLDATDFQVHTFSNRHKISSFKCENADFERYLKKEAITDHNNNIGRVFLMIEKKTENVAGFVTLAMGNVPKQETNDSKPNTRYPNIPGLLLGQLAAHQDYRGMGSILLDFVIKHALDLTQKIGCRVVYVHSIKGKEWWYERKGFTRVEGTERTFFIDLFIDEPERY